MTDEASVANNLADCVLASFIVHPVSPCECEDPGCTEPATVTVQVSDLRGTTCDLHFLGTLSATLAAFHGV